MYTVNTADVNKMTKNMQNLNEVNYILANPVDLFNVIGMKMRKSSCDEIIYLLISAESWHILFLFVQNYKHSDDRIL